STIFLFLIGMVLYAINLTLFAFFQREQLYFRAVLVNMLPALAKGGAGAAVYFGLMGLDLEQSFLIFALALATSVMLIPFLPARYTRINFSLTAATDFLKEIKWAGFAHLISQSWNTVSNIIAKVLNNFAGVG